MKVSAIQKQKEALQAKLAKLAEKEKEAEKAEKAEKAKAKLFEKNQAFLASILLQHFNENFVNLDLEVLKAEVVKVLTPKQKESKPVEEVKPVVKAVETVEVVKSATSEEE